jgi:ADP-ribose pyrophosphatase
MEEPQSKDWQTLSRRLAFDASPWLRHWVETVKLPTGEVATDFHTVESREFAVVLALTSDGLVVGERQYRHGVGEVCFVLPAGYLEQSEGPLAAAQRELLEETGYQADEWRALGSYVVDGNRGCGRMHAFLAREARRATEQTLDRLEQIDIELRPLNDLLRMLANGEIKTLPTAATLGLAQLALTNGAFSGRALEGDS